MLCYRNSTNASRIVTYYVKNASADLAATKHTLEIEEANSTKKNCKFIYVRMKTLIVLYWINSSLQ